MLYWNLLILLQAVVSGSITADGRPVEGALVNFMSGAANYSATVDQSGRFRVDVPAGTYSLSIERKIGRRINRMNIPAVTLEDGPANLTLYWPTGDDAQRQANMNEAFNAASADMASGRYGAAVDGFRKALTYDTAQAPVWASLALAYIGLKQYEDALDAGLMAIRFAPEGAAYHNNLGGTLFRMGRYNDAIKRYTRAAEVNPAGKGVYYSNIAACHIAQADYSGASSAYKTAVEDANVPSSSWYYYGAVLQHNGNTSDALTALRRYLAIAPNGPYASDAESRVRVLSGQTISVPSYFWK